MDPLLLWALVSLFAFLVFWDFAETFRESQAGSKDRVLQLLGLKFFPNVFPAVLRLGHRLNGVEGLEGIDQRAHAVLGGADPGALQEDLERRMAASRLSVEDFKELGSLVDTSAELFRNRKSLVFYYDECVRVGDLARFVLLLVPFLGFLAWGVGLVPQDGSPTIAAVVFRLSQGLFVSSLLAFVYGAAGVFGFLFHRNRFLRDCARHGVTVSKQKFDVSLILKAVGFGKGR